MHIVNCLIPFFFWRTHLKNSGRSHQLSGNQFNSCGETPYMTQSWKIFHNIVREKFVIFGVSPPEIKWFSGQLVTATGFFCGLWIPHGYPNFSQTQKVGNEILKLIHCNATYLFILIIPIVPTYIYYICLYVWHKNVLSH